MQNQSNLLDIGSVPKRLNSVKSWYDPWIICVKAILVNKSPKGINFSPLSHFLALSLPCKWLCTLWVGWGVTSFPYALASYRRRRRFFIYLFIYMRKGRQCERKWLSERQYTVWKRTYTLIGPPWIWQKGKEVVVGPWVPAIRNKCDFPVCSCIYFFSWGLFLLFLFFF